MATARDNLARKQIYIPATQPEEEIVLRVAPPTAVLVPIRMIRLTVSLRKIIITLK